MPERCHHLKFRDFVRSPECYHFARTELRIGNAARYHDHDYHEVFWVTRGRGRHLWNGRDSELHPGTIHLIRPQDRHRVTGSDDEPMWIVNVAFPVKAWRDLRQRYFTDEPDWFALPDEQRVWSVDVRAKAVLHYWTERLAAVSRPQVALDGFVMELPRLRPTLGRANEPVPEWLSDARKKIARLEHFSGGTAEFARLAGRSPSHVSRATVRWLGLTPTDLVNAARMDYSATQLAETTRPIIDIMLDCGLNNLSHFYTLFRQRFRMSPRRYRLQAHPTVLG